MKVSFKQLIVWMYCKCLPLFSHHPLCLSLLILPQCTTSTLEDESQALTTARTPLGPASLPCICLMMEKEALSISKSLLRLTQPTNTPTSSTLTTPLLRTKPPSTQTASSTWTLVGADPFIHAFLRVQSVKLSASFPLFVVTFRTQRGCHGAEPDERHGGWAPGGYTHRPWSRARLGAALSGEGGLHR